MVSVTNYMWMCTADHKLYIVHTATMRTFSCVTFENSLQQVLQLLHVPEWHMVIVVWESSEIWCLYDEVDKSGVNMIGQLQLHNNKPISALCKVICQQTTVVWGTRKDKEILVLTQSPTGCCVHKILECSISDETISFNCNLITSLVFDNTSGESMTHVWVSFEGNSQLVCWNAGNKSQLHSVSLHCEGENYNLIV